MYLNMKLRLAWEILLLLTMILVLLSLWSGIEVKVWLTANQAETLDRIDVWLTIIADQLEIDLAK